MFNSISGCTMRIKINILCEPEVTYYIDAQIKEIGSVLANTQDSELFLFSG